MIRCHYCGQFIGFDDIEHQRATHYFEPLSEFGPEISEWQCEKCLFPPAIRKLVEEGRRIGAFAGDAS